MAMKLVPTSAQIDFSGFPLPTKVAALVTEAVRQELADDPPSLDLPIMWDSAENPSDGRGGPAPTDPVMLYLDLPFGATEEDRVCYSCSLADVVDDLIGALEAGDSDKVEDAQGQAICARVAARLRELADKLDDACRP